MKELSIEEKAKLYDEAIERAKIKRDEYIRLDGPESHVPQDIEFIFPVLKESEDEMIRNEIIDYLKRFIPHHEYDLVAKSRIWIDWLEKQGEQNNDKIIERARTEKQRVLLTETNGDAHIDWDCRSLRDVKSLLKYGLEYIDAQLEKQGEKNESKKIEPWTAWVDKEDEEKKPTDEVEVKPKFKVGDWIVTPDNKVKQIEKVTFGNYWFTDESLYDITDVDNKGHLWTIQDARNGDILVTHLSPEGDWVGIYKQSIDIIGFNTYCFLNSMGEFVINPNRCKNHGTHGLHPATKEQRDLLFTKMKDMGYEWDVEKKELRKIEKLDSAWSEEDERERERVVGLLEGWLSTFKETYYAKDCKRGIGWLKSLKDRVQPQPKQEWSEEDETLMNSSISYLCNLRDSFKREYDKEAVQTCIYWIKSLLSRFNSAIQWRPTEEQMEALKNMLHPDVHYYELLKSLYNDLKKL